MHLNCELLFRKYAINYFRDDYKVLEIGSTAGDSVFRKIINNPSIKWYTLDIGTEWIGDIANEPLHVNSNSEYSYPFDDETFDIVLSGNVMEHVAEVWTWFAEIKRITKTSGIIITISPISWDYHATPIDCWRIYPDGMSALMRQQGLATLVNTFESLEKTCIPKSSPTLPGNSSFRMDTSLRKRTRVILLYNRIMHFSGVFRIFRIPIPICYDIICICQKK